VSEERKFALLFAATILVAGRLAELGHKPCPARDAAIADAVAEGELIRRTIDNLYPPPR
jgi:hypothetical protein